MFGDQGDIRAIRVICGESGRKIGHQKHEKSQKRKLSFGTLISANRR
jgi:hypothetical protein